MQTAAFISRIGAAIPELPGSVTSLQSVVVDLVRALYPTIYGDIPADPATPDHRPTPKGLQQLVQSHADAAAHPSAKNLFAVARDAAAATGMHDVSDYFAGRVGELETKTRFYSFRTMFQLYENTVVNSTELALDLFTVGQMILTELLPTEIRPIELEVVETPTGDQEEIRDIAGPVIQAFDDLISVISTERLDETYWISVGGDMISAAQELLELHEENEEAVDAIEEFLEGTPLFNN